MRELTEHKVNPVSDVLTITVVDEPGSGGANHVYFISGVDFDNNPGDRPALNYANSTDTEGLAVLFQNGPIAEAGVNGVTHEALIAILCDRLRSFQAGPFSSPDNADALDHLEQALTALKRRTKGRMDRGVEGTHTI